MYRLLTTIILFLAAHGAGAQCVATTPATPAVAHARPAAELIKTAAAGTRDGAAAEAEVVATAAKPAPGEERHRPSGRAMLFAVIALMSGIALRRASASDE